MIRKWNLAHGIAEHTVRCHLNCFISLQNSSEVVPDSASAVGATSSGDGIVDKSAASTTSDDDDDDFHDAVDEINVFEVRPYYWETPKLLI